MELGKSWADLSRQAGEPWQQSPLPSGPGGTPALAPLQTVQTEELHSIRGELSQIKAQVDRLLENLEHMDQQRDQLPGGTPPTGGPGHIPSELQLFPLLKVPGAPGILSWAFPLQGSFLPSPSFPPFPTPSGCFIGFKTLWLLGCSMSPPPPAHPLGNYLEAE